MFVNYFNSSRKISILGLNFYFNSKILDECTERKLQSMMGLRLSIRNRDKNVIEYGTLQ